MKLTQTTINALKIDPVVMFKGTQAEQLEAQAKEAAAIAQLKNIIENPDFLAMTIQPRTASDVERILHHSIYPGYDFQISVFYKSEPISHHNYNINGTGYQSMKQLYNDIINLIYTDHHINIDVLTA